MSRPSFRSSSALPTATIKSNSEPEYGFAQSSFPTPSPGPSIPSSSNLGKMREKKAGRSRRPRKEFDLDHPLVERQGASSGPVFENYPSCDNVGNTLLSCFPQSNTTITQSTWSKFIWNANYPTFVENGQVDVWLYQADSGEEVDSWRGITNGQGSIEIRPEEDWWRDQDRATELTPGGTEMYSYYFVVVPGGQTLNGGERHQNTFRAVQTALPSAVLASISSASRASVTSASAAAAASSSSSASATATGTQGGGERRPDGTLQNEGSRGSSFPKWVGSTPLHWSFRVLTPSLRIHVGYCCHRHSRRLPDHLPARAMVVPLGRLSTEQEARKSSGKGQSMERRGRGSHT